MHVSTDIGGTFTDVVTFDFFTHAYGFLLDEGKLKPPNGQHSQCLFLVQRINR